MARRSVTAFALTLALFSPIAGALPFEASFETQAPMSIAGNVTIEASGGGFVSDEGAATREIVLAGLTGTIRIAEYDGVRADLPGAPVTERIEEPEVRDITVRNATLRIRVDNEWLGLVLVPEEGSRLWLSGVSDDRGSPRSVPPHGPASEGVSSPRGDPRLQRPDPPMDPGARFFGDPYGVVTSPGYPAIAQAIVHAEGALTFWVGGGNATLEAAEGTTSERLGNWSTDGFGFAAGSIHWARLRFDGNAASVDFTAGEDWSYASRDASLHVDGRSAWSRATGEARANGNERTFDAAEVLVIGQTRHLAAGNALSEGASGPADRIAFEVAGDAEVLVVNGESLSSSGVRAAPVSSIATASIVGAFLLILASSLLAFYTRIAASEALDNPTRRKIYEAILATPGIHKREIMRAVSCAYGPLHFHLRVLKNGGYIGSKNEGRYLQYFATAGGSVADLAIPNPLTRAIFDALSPSAPEDARVVAARHGISRQLASYHLQKLHALGKIERAGEGRGSPYVRLGTAEG